MAAVTDVNLAESWVELRALSLVANWAVAMAEKLELKKTLLSTTHHSKCCLY